MTVNSRCICTAIGEPALAKIVESHTDSATYVDAHPWIVARELLDVNPIWEPLDSLVLAPSAEQLHREAVEPVHMHRQMLDEQHIWPYAVCETPAFIAERQA